MNRQEIFNKVAKHLLTQGTKSWKSRTSASCLYRSKDGKKCAIGCLIPDELYDPKMEYKDVHSLLQSFQPLKELLKVKDVGDEAFLQNIQTVHDIVSEDSWKSSLEYLGEQYELDTSVLEDF